MPTNWNNLGLKEQWKRRLQRWAIDNSSPEVIRTALHDASFWTQFTAQRTTIEDFVTTCLRLKDEADFEPGVPPFWCLLLATLERMGASGDYQAIRDWHYDLKGIQRDGQNIVPYDLFISYSRPDNSPIENDSTSFADPAGLWVTQMAAILARDGLEPSVYLGSDHILADALPADTRMESYRQMMEPLIAAAKHYVLVMSPSYLAYPVCRWEMLTILNEAAANRDKRVIVVERRRIVDKQRLIAGTADALGHDLPPELWKRHDAWLPFWHYDPSHPTNPFPPLPVTSSAFNKVVPDINRCIKSRPVGVQVFVAETVPELEAERQKLRRSLYVSGCVVLPRGNLNPVNYSQSLNNVLSGDQHHTIDIKLSVIIERPEDPSQALLLQPQRSVLRALRKPVTTWQHSLSTGMTDGPITGTDELGIIWQGGDVSRLTDDLIRQIECPLPRAESPDVVVLYEKDNEEHAFTLMGFLQAKAEPVLKGPVKPLDLSVTVDQWEQKVDFFLTHCRRLFGVYVPDHQPDTLEWLRDKIQELHDLLVEKNRTNEVGLRLCVLPPPRNWGGELDVRVGRDPLKTLDYTRGWGDEKVIDDTIAALS